MAIVRMLFFLGTAFFAFVEVRAAPRKYDQRQDGKSNLHAHLENFLFVVAIPNYNQQFGEVVADGTLDFLSAITSRAKEQDLIKAGEIVHQEEPYTMEIFQINENRPDKENSVRKTEGGNAETLNVADQQPTPVSDGQTAERVAKNVKNFEFPKSREVPVIPGYFVNVRKPLGPKTGNGRARNVVGNVWNPDDEPGRPGTSLKKQLPRRGEEYVALPSSNVDKNNVSSFTEEKQQELILIGDGVENCGPGRRRDSSGVCQFDGSVDSLL